LKARDAGTLSPNQIKVPKQADILMRGLAAVGIIALVDEATGYQDWRSRNALAQKSLWKLRMLADSETEFKGSVY
jgi:hypothetical protein